jgi:hypothetical protein
MDAATPSKRARTTAASASIASTPQKPKIGAATLFADQVATPEKPAKKAPAAAYPIWTPEKTEQRPLRRKGCAAVAEEEEDEEEEEDDDVDDYEDEEEEDALEPVARELRVGAEVKLPER